MIRAYKYRIYPNQEQEILINKHLNQELTLKDRFWTCTSCGTHHDRDVLAANNIKKFAFVKQNTNEVGLCNNTVGTTEIHALRDMTKVTRSAQETAKSLV
jgi:transposase